MNKNKIFSSLLLCAAFGASAAQYPILDSSDGKQQHWITIGTDAMPELQSVGGIPFAQDSITASTGNKEVTIAQINDGQLNALSRLMHKNHKRCGGYIVHDSLQEALTVQQMPAISSAAFAANPPSQGTTVNRLLPNLVKSNIMDTVTYLSTTFNNRYYTTTGGTNASSGLMSRWQNIVSGLSFASVSQVTHSGYGQKSVLVTLTGSEKPDEIVVLGAHLDSTVGSTGESSTAPGADDDASGVATLTEVMRVFVSEGQQPKRTVKFYAYAAEEVGLRGSNDIANQHANAGANVVGVMQLDMTAYQGSTYDIVMMQDYTNAAQNSYIATLLDTYLPSISYSYDNCGYGCSDHASWNNAGYPASMPFESMMSQYNPNIHTSQDTMANMDNTGTKELKFAQMALAYVIELSSDTAATPPPTSNVLTNGVPATGLTASSGSDVVYTMDVPTGATNITFTTSGGTGDADLYTKFGSTPTDSSYDCRPYKSGNSESCTGTQTGGTYYIRVKAYSTYSGVTLTGSYTDGGSGGGGSLPTVNETRTSVSVGSGSWQHYTQALDAGYTSFDVTMSGGTGDADLYVTQGAQSTSSAYDCRPYKNGNSESCSFSSPAAGTWYIDLYGYSAASGITLTWQATP